MIGGSTLSSMEPRQAVLLWFPLRARLEALKPAHSAVHRLTSMVIMVVLHSIVRSEFSKNDESKILSLIFVTQFKYQCYTITSHHFTFISGKRKVFLCGGSNYASLFCITTMISELSHKFEFNADFLFNCIVSTVYIEGLLKFDFILILKNLIICTMVFMSLVNFYTCMY